MKVMTYLHSAKLFVTYIHNRAISFFTLFDFDCAAVRKIHKHTPEYHTQNLKTLGQYLQIPQLS